jgi:hypothetical protein
VQVGLSHPHGSIQNIYLEVAHADDRRQRHRIAVRASEYRDNPSQQLLGGEWHGEDVVDAPLECGKFGAQVPSPMDSVSRLSNDMAVALAAMWPPLRATGVRRAADQLDKSDVALDRVANGVITRSAVERINMRNLVEALRALRDCR